MSERKTTEIKLRVTPAEKAAWQLAAEEEGIGLSELIRREMNARAEQSDNPLAAIAARDVRTARGAEFPAWSPVAATKAVGTSGDTDSVAKSWMFEARASE